MVLVTKSKRVLNTFTRFIYCNGSAYRIIHFLRKKKSEHECFFESSIYRKPWNMWTPLCILPARHTIIYLYFELITSFIILFLWKNVHSPPSLLRKLAEILKYVSFYRITKRFKNNLMIDRKIENKNNDHLRVWFVDLPSGQHEVGFIFWLRTQIIFQS